MRPQLKLLSEMTRRDEPPSAERPLTLASLLASRPVSSQSGPVERDASSDDDVIDVGGVVRMLHVGRNKVYEMVARNEIPHRRFGRRIRFSRTAIMRWLDSWSPRIVKEGQ
jgi:excisionase family DNA binding protein